MKPSEVAAHLMNPSLHADITFPEPRRAVKIAAEFMFDLAELQFAAECVLRSDDEVSRQLLRAAVNQVTTRAAA